jgi:hypothetical protein
VILSSFTSIVHILVISQIDIHHDTGCFAMNDTKVFAYFSGYDTSPDLKHVATFYRDLDILVHIGYRL